MSDEYVEAIGRNPGEEKQHSHLYKKIAIPTDIAALTGLGARTGYEPMCIYGWNRGGNSFSIFRGHSGARGLCKICDKRAKLGLPPAKPSPRNTKWL